MEVHSGLSARIADKAGFDALWASGLAISTLMGLRDCNEVSSTQILTIVEWITDATSKPLLVDGDSGHGNFNNARLFARKLRDRGASGVCFEDKLFPKLNSFVGEHQPLAAKEEFAGRISAAKDATAGSNFCVIARTEALISNRGMAEALDRAAAYQEAGADAILIHSKQSTPTEVIDFAERWGCKTPLLIVPTTYPDLNLDSIQKAGISGVIWANQNIRATAQAMINVCADLVRTKLPKTVENQIVSITDLFTLLDYDELNIADNRYLPEIYQR